MPDAFSRAPDSVVEELLSRMTLEEKVNQLVYVSCAHDLHESMIRSGIGVVANVFSRDRAQRLQAIATSETRLGIPLLIGADVIHGFRTIFPICLGEACSWDLDLIERSSRLAAQESVEEETYWIFGPMLDIARDPRWGRIAEGAGEDTYLAAMAGRARIRGINAGGGLACAKHFVAYGACEGGRDYNTADMSQMTLREVYLPPFRAAVDEGVGSVMVAFNEIDGVPCTADSRLLNGVLRTEWGFGGIIATDYNAVRELIAHGVARDERHACRLAVEAGVDLDMQSGIFFEHLADLVREGAVAESRVDESVRRMLAAKTALGLFDDARPSRLPVDRRSLRETALESALKSMVLLKNDDALLPLDRRGGPIALIGPFAEDGRAPLGWWRCVGREEETVTVAAGLRALAGLEREIGLERGCDVASDDRSGFEAAVELARASAVAILVVGERAEMVGEAHSRSAIELPGVQEDLVAAVAATGTPVVLVLVNGRPLALERVVCHATAIVEAWMPGTYTGEALASLLFGDTTPSGKLTTSFPRRTGQVPVYYNHKNTGRPARSRGSADGEFDISAGDTARYLDVEPEALFPFGFGLSYTSFAYGEVKLGASRIAAGESVTASAMVQNIGAVAAEEIVQAYLRRPAAGVTRPVAELSAFARVRLEPGEERCVELTVDGERFGYFDRDARWVIEPGVIDLRIGPDSTRGRAARLEIVPSGEGGGM